MRKLTVPCWGSEPLELWRSCRGNVTLFTCLTHQMVLEACENLPLQYGVLHTHLTRSVGCESLLAAVGVGN